PVILKQRIMAIQDERERLLLLYNEFVGDNIVNTGDRNTKQYTKAFWKLVDKLTSAFNYPDPTQYDLFLYAQEMKPDGYTRIFNFYQKGLIQLYNILHEDIYKTKEVVTKGRCVKELVSVSAKEYLLSLKNN
ncbi:14345_t:CDS:1, partial [Gigaspora rosea]